MRHHLAVIPAALCALTLAACGGDDGAGDEEAIRDVLVRGVTTDDPQVECVETVTPEFVRTVYGSQDDCRRAEREPEDRGEKATGAKVTDIRIDGDRATAQVEMEGGNTAGASGEISFARDGGDWKVDGLSMGFLRSQVRRGLANSDEEPFDDPAFRSCFGEKLDALPDEQFRRFAYDAIADRDGAQEVVTPLLVACQSGASSGGDDAAGDSGSGGGKDLSFIRRKFEEGIESEAREDGVPAARITCIKRELRKSISDDEILEQATKGGGKASPEIIEATAKAIQACS